MLAAFEIEEHELIAVHGEAAAGFPFGLDITPILDRRPKTQRELPMLGPEPVVSAFPGDVNG
jgi:hypothetical protein